jgi:transporter family-2 protein
MDGISSVWLYPIILAAGALQAWGPPMNGALRVALTNPWLASLISFLPVVALLLCLLLCAPRPLPTSPPGSPGCHGGRRSAGSSAPSPSWRGSCSSTRSARAPSPGLTITANILMSLLIDKFGMCGMPQHPLSATRIVGALLMVGGIALISRA